MTEAGVRPDLGRPTSDFAQDEYTGLWRHQTARVKHEIRRKRRSGWKAEEPASRNHPEEALTRR
jgi:hypothetical protein